MAFVIENLDAGVVTIQGKVGEKHEGIKSFGNLKYSSLMSDIYAAAQAIATLRKYQDNDIFVTKKSYLSENED